MQTYAQNVSFPRTFSAGTPYVLTVLIDHMGQDEEAPGTDAIKFPRGILDYAVSGHSQTEIIWKMTGNLGGGQYRDIVRGPLNEGALYAERQGYHLPGAPAWNWSVRNPVTEGIPRAGVGFFATTFDLNVPEGYDVPMKIVFNSTSTTTGIKGIKGEKLQKPTLHKRVSIREIRYVPSPSPFVIILSSLTLFTLFIVNNIGPQTSFPILEGILNHNGTNYIALTLWALDAQDARLSGGFDLLPSLSMPVKSGYRKPGLAPGVSRSEGWRVREGAY
ncbi:hypothetical protein VTN96DRAFT_402 [Rasamsonia emersonii]